MPLRERSTHFQAAILRGVGTPLLRYAFSLLDDLNISIDLKKMIPLLRLATLVVSRYQHSQQFNSSFHGED